MMNKGQILFGLLIVVFMSSGMAQIVNYNGLGRMYVVDDQFKGDLIDKDTISPSSGTSGYTLFDLGVNVHPGDALKASAVLRSRAEFGGFFGDGASLLFRQFNISGVLGRNGKGVKYEIGDLDLQMTDFTLLNNEEMYHAFESSLFSARRDIVSYENFNFGSKWRLQGARVSTRLKFDQLVESADVDLFATRTKNSPVFLEPDRFLLGGTIDVFQSKKLKLSVNSITLLDAKNTVAMPSNEYTNGVHSGTVGYQKAFGIAPLDIGLEGGISTFGYTDQNESVQKNDYFYHLKVGYEMKKVNAKATVAYRNVGFDFLSPGAQSRRIYDAGVPTVFGAINEGTGVRSLTLYDRYSQEGAYNQSISPVLMHYNPRYNLVTPYGMATPNRQGISLSVQSIDVKRWYQFKAQADLLKELVGEGVKAKRGFVSLFGGAKLKLSDLIDFKKEINLTTGFKYESASREDDLVDFSTSTIDVGIDVEVLNKLYIQVGYKQLVSSGSEYIGVRDEFNDISGYTAYNATSGNSNIGERVLSAGVSYEFGKYSVFSLSSHTVSFANSDIDGVNYMIQEFFFGYTLKF